MPLSTSMWHAYSDGRRYQVSFRDKGGYVIGISFDERLKRWAEPRKASSSPKVNSTAEAETRIIQFGRALGLSSKLILHKFEWRKEGEDKRTHAAYIRAEFHYSKGKEVAKICIDPSDGALVTFDPDLRTLPIK